MRAYFKTNQHFMRKRLLLTFSEKDGSRCFFGLESFYLIIFIFVGKIKGLDHCSTNDSYTSKQMSNKSRKIFTLIELSTKDLILKLSLHNGLISRTSKSSKKIKSS